MVHGKFIQNVLRAALPGGLSDLLLILGIEAFVFAFELPIGTLTTLTTLLLLAVGMAVLWDVCKPFHRGSWCAVGRYADFGRCGDRAAGRVPRPGTFWICAVC